MPPIVTFPATDGKRDLICKTVECKDYGNLQEAAKAVLKPEFIGDCCLAWTCNNHLISKLSDIASWMNFEIPSFGFCPWCGHSINK